MYAPGPKRSPTSDNTFPAPRQGATFFYPSIPGVAALRPPPANIHCPAGAAKIGYGLEGRMDISRGETWKVAPRKRNAVNWRPPPEPKISPQISFIEFHPGLPQKSQVFLLKRPRLVMGFLVLDVILDRFAPVIADRVSTVPILPGALP